MVMLKPFTNILILLYTYLVFGLLPKGRSIIIYSIISLKKQFYFDKPSVSLY